MGARQVAANKTSETGTSVDFPEIEAPIGEILASGDVAQHSLPMISTGGLNGLERAPAQSSITAIEPIIFTVPAESLLVATVPRSDFFAPQEQSNIVNHLNQLLAHEADILPMPITEDTLISNISEGQLLPRLLANIDQNVLDVRALNTAPIGETLSPHSMLQNQTLLVNAAASIGAAVPRIHPTQLWYAPDNEQVALNQTWNVIQHGLFSSINVLQHPELKPLFEDGEKPSQVPTETVLARFLNHHVQNYLAEHPQDKSKLPANFKVDDNLTNSLTIPIAMTLHQLAKTPTTTNQDAPAPTNINDLNRMPLPLSAGGAGAPFAHPNAGADGSETSSQDAALSRNPLQHEATLVQTNPSTAQQADPRMLSQGRLPHTGNSGCAGMPPKGPGLVGGNAPNSIYSMNPLLRSGQSRGGSCDPRRMGPSGPTAPAICVTYTNNPLMGGGRPGGGSCEPHGMGPGGMSEPANSALNYHNPLVMPGGQHGGGWCGQHDMGPIGANLPTADSAMNSNNPLVSGNQPDGGSCGPLGMGPSGVDAPTKSATNSNNPCMCGGQPSRAHGCSRRIWRQSSMPSQGAFRTRAAKMTRPSTSLRKIRMRPPRSASSATGRSLLDSS